MGQAKDDDQTKWTTKITAVATQITAATAKGDTGGALDLISQAGFAGMELTRLSGSEGRKGKG